MGKITFAAWLMKQKNRSDAVGDLAGDLVESGLYDSPQYTYGELIRLAKGRNTGKNVLDALDMAYAEWELLFC